MSEPTLSPTYDGERRSWMVGQLPIAWFGLALDAPPTELPKRWKDMESGTEEVTPSDLEFEWVLHALAHEVARAKGAELRLLTTECWFVGDQMPAALLKAAESSQTLAPWCSGPAWHWRTEMREGPWLHAHARRAPLWVTLHPQVRCTTNARPTASSRQRNVPVLG